MLEEDSLLIGNNDFDYSDFKREKCGICMEIIIDRGVLDCCQHWFCFACIDNWSTITNLCPLCQNEFQLITCVPVYDTIGTNNSDEDPNSRDDEWSIEEKSNTLSFPSYYIDENAVICLDGDGCKIRHATTIFEEDSNLDTSIACDSCDIWYHAFCVGFDPEATSEDTWLCPRCVVEVPQKSSENSIQRTDNNCSPENASVEYAETAFSRKLSVSVADAGETAVVISMVEDNEHTEAPKENSPPVLEVDKSRRNHISNLDSNCIRANSHEKSYMQQVHDGEELELSLSRDRSFRISSNSLPSKLKKGCAVENSNEQSNKLHRSEPRMGIHLGLSVCSFLSVDAKGDENEDQATEQGVPAGESLPRACKMESGVTECDTPITGIKRKHADSRNADDKKAKVYRESRVSLKKVRSEGKTQMVPCNEERSSSDLNDCHKTSTSKAGPKDDSSGLRLEKEDVASDIMSIVKGIGRRHSKLMDHNPADGSTTERENASGLRVKKIIKRATEDKDSSAIVQNLRKEIREAVRNRSTEAIGEHLFDPKLLAAFRAAVVGPKDEHVKKLSPMAVKVKKSILEKGKVRENLTKKIYANSNGKRRRAWDRDLEVEFWKYRCMRATKPEKVETLKSVLDLLRKNSQGTDTEQANEGQTTNPILSRLYLADTSVFPRKDDVRPLSALKDTGNSDKEQIIFKENGSKPLPDNCVPKVDEKIKISSKVGFPSNDEKGTRNDVSCSTSDQASNKVNLNRHPDKQSASLLSNSQKGVTAKSDNVKMDKRKWALEILARKTSVTDKSAAHEEKEDNATLKGGNYPLLAQLPKDMRPLLASSRRNKIPISVRQMQLYRLAELFLRKANLPVICRTAESELAIADAINIEKEVADRSNSKLVYMNLCSQEILHRSDNKKSSETTESNLSAPSADNVERAEQATEDSTDPTVLEALGNAGLLPDSPPNSTSHQMEVQTEVNGSSMETIEEVPDSVFEMDAMPEEDIYGDFEYDLEDEDYIGASSVKVSSLQPEETVSKVKVVFSTLNSEKLTEYGGKNDVKLESTREAGVKNLTGEEGEDLSLAECEELYGPDKEPVEAKFSKASQQFDGEAPAVIKSPGESSNQEAESYAENAPVSTTSHQKSSNTRADEQCDNVISISKKVEAYIKEHIRPLCKSGVITAEQYRWAVTKTTDKVMRYHSKAKNAKFLIKEGEKVKKLAEQYIEAAQQKGITDHL